MTRMQRSRFGFTLIELLVVIAIIAILAAILFPIYATAKEAGRRAKCQVMLREVALGVRMYADDSNDKMPIQFVHYVENWRSPTAGRNWLRSVQPYIKKAYAIYVCPSAATAAGHSTNLNSLLGNGEVFQWLIGNTDYPLNRSGYPVSAIKKHSATVIIQCFRYQVNSANLRPFLNLPLGWDQATMWDWVSHNDGQNFAFADGHVRWLKQTYVKANLEALFVPGEPGKYPTVGY